MNEGAVREAVLQGRMTITYAFDPHQQPPTLIDPAAVVQLGSPEATGTRIFNSRLFADRLGLSVGPVVLSHTYGWKRHRKRFKQRWGQFDLRESGGAIALQPGESVTINTIESIRLGSDVCALVVPRLALATAGLVVTTSYVDAYWDGLLVLNVVNTGGRPVELRFGEAFAQAFFFKLQGPHLSHEVQARFVAKSHHYGMTWTSILGSDRDPIPLRKHPQYGLFRRYDWTMAALWKRAVSALAFVGIPVMVLVTALIMLGRLQDRLDQLSSVQQSQSAIASDIAELRTEARNDPVSGRSTAIIKAGETTAQTTSDLPPMTDSDRVALATLVPSDPQVSADARIVGTRGASSLLITIRTADATRNDRSFDVVWAVL